MAESGNVPIPEPSSAIGHVAVVVARSIEHAETFRELLEDHDIPSMLGTEDDLDRANDASNVEGESPMTPGVPVLVPERLLDEASEIIADREDFDELNEDDTFDDEDDEAFSLDDNMTEELGPIFDEDEDEDEDTG